MVRPATLTGFEVPVTELAKVAVALAVLNVTLSPLTTPLNAAVPLLSSDVAFVLPSYTLLVAVMLST